MIVLQAELVDQQKNSFILRFILHQYPLPLSGLGAILSYSFYRSMFYVNPWNFSMVNLFKFNKISKQLFFLILLQPWKIHTKNINETAIPRKISLLFASQVSINKRSHSHQGAPAFVSFFKKCEICWEKYKANFCVVTAHSVVFSVQIFLHLVTANKDMKLVRNWF